jgi:hypothetical protein
MIADQSPTRFNDDDIRKIVDAQAIICANLAVASTNLAVASNNIDWVVKTYATEYTKLAELQIELGKLKNDFWKYVGIGIGASAAISIFITILPYIVKSSGSG